MPFDLQGLHDLMQSASEHLDHAVQSGDEEKAERMHGILNRANNLAEQQIQFHQQQAQGLPGLGSGQPTDLIPRGAMGPGGQEGPKGLPGGNQGYEAFAESQRESSRPSAPAMPTARPPLFGGDPNAMPDNTRHDPGDIRGGWQPNDVTPSNIFKGALATSPVTAPLYWSAKALGTGVAQPLIESVTEDKPLFPAIGEAWNKLTSSEAEKVAGSQENARMMQQRGNPEASPAVPPTPSTPQTNLQPSEADMKMDGSYYAMPPANQTDGNKLYEDIYQRAIKGGHNDEADRIGRYRQILEQKPNFFTGERLMSFLLAGAPATMKEYNNEMSQWKGWMGKESELAQHYGAQSKALAMSKEGLNEERIKKMQLEEAKLAYDQLDKQHQRQLAPLMAELHELGENDKAMTSNNNAILIPNAKEQIAHNAVRRQQLLKEFNAHAGNTMRQLPK